MAHLVHPTAKPSSSTRVRLRRARYERTKRAFDILLTLGVMLAALPLMLLCAVLILLEDGRPILFSQMRTGRAGRRFRLYKFRTMVQNAEELKHTLSDFNQLSGPDFKIPEDPRVTRVGYWLRRFSLDELPQLFGVLRGQMSLVGPRPTSFEVSQYDLWHTERLEVIPGLTGLWQVNGRADVDFDQRARLDIEYVRRRSMLFDLRILLKTFRAILDQRGAY